MPNPNRINKNKWGLPTVLEPDGTIPLCVNVPNDPQWIAKFYGALWELTLVRNWDWNEANDRAIVAARWLQVWQDLVNGGCEDMNCAELLACLYGGDDMVRMNPETGRIEKSSDGGETWEEDTVSDPRFNNPRWDMGALDDCERAHMMVGFIQGLVDALIEQIDIGANILNVTAAATGFIVLLFGITPWAVVGIALAEAISGLTSVAIEAALTADVWERLLCNIQARIAGEDTVTTEMFDGIMERLGVDETGIAYTVLWHAINQLGPVGLQNSVKAGLEPSDVPADCDDCGVWCYTFDLTASNGGFTVVPDRNCSWESGTGWVEGVWSAPDGGNTRYYATINVRKTWDEPTVITRIAMTFSGDNGFIDSAPAINNQINGYNGATQEFNDVQNENFGSNITQEWNGSEVLDRFELQCSVGTRLNSTTGIQSANFRLHSVTIEGEGENPFGASNC